jgi:hypothetical protein
MVGITATHVEAIFNPSIEGPQTAFWLWTLFAIGLFVAIISRRGADRPAARGRGRSNQPGYDLIGMEQLLRDL